MAITNTCEGIYLSLRVFYNNKERLVDNVYIARVVELVDTQDLNKLSAPRETSEVEPLKFGETLFLSSF